MKWVHILCGLIGKEYWYIIFTEIAPTENFWVIPGRKKDFSGFEESEFILKNQYGYLFTNCVLCRQHTVQRL